MKKPGKIKSLVRDILYSPDDKKGWLYKIDDVFITGLIIASVVVIIIESFDSVYREYKLAFEIFDIFTVVVFTIEYFARIWVSDLIYEGGPVTSRRKYIFSFLGLIDLLAILPFYLPFFVKLDLRVLRILRLLRLLRIFKLAHYSESLRMVSDVFRKQKRELLITLAGTFIIILITATMMYEIEHDVQPDQFPNVFATFWWAIATLTTIGYGDVYPVTGIGQFLAAVTAIFGIGLVAIPTGILSMGFMEELQKRNAKKKESEVKKSHNHKEMSEDWEYCPHCGEKLE